MKRIKVASRFKYDCKAFNDVLFDRAPMFDAEILKGWDPNALFLLPIRIDVRLLPNGLRRKWLILKGWNRSRRKRSHRSGEEAWVGKLSTMPWDQFSPPTHG